MNQLNKKQKHSPKVSIGMPVYNGEQFICEALDSLITQTFTEFELVISDNASTDETQAICELYARRDSRIRYVRQTENKGALANFHFVLNEAMGKYFMWAAADDLWDEHWIEFIYNRIFGETGLAGFGELAHIDANARALQHPANGAKLKFGGDHSWRKLSFYLAYEGTGKANLFYAIYPRDALQRIDLRSYRFDYQILFSLLDQVTYVQVDQVCFYKRIHGGCEGVNSESVRRSPILLAPIRVLQRDVHISTHYLECVKPRLKMVLLLLTPIKLLIALKFHIVRSASLMFNKLNLLWT